MQTFIRTEFIKWLSFIPAWAVRSVQLGLKYNRGNPGYAE